MSAGSNGRVGTETGLRIAILGTRGVPGAYGGFETFAEELGGRLVDRGHRVTIYCRTSQPHRPRSHRGMRLTYLPAIHTKSLETLSHTYLSALHAAVSRFDIVYVCNSANAPICWIPWLMGQAAVLNVDGLEWRRAKWGSLAKSYYRWASRHAAGMPIEVVTDARVIQEYYATVLGRATRCIAYGTVLYDRGHGMDRLAGIGLEPDRYLLYVSRLEPENNALLVVQAYANLETDLPLVVVGDAPYAREYIARVRAEADPRVRFVGYRFGDDYHALQANARIYLQATEVGGTHPALVEALGHRNAIIAHDVAEHREVLGEAARYFAFRDSSDLTRVMRTLLEDEAAVKEYRTRAAARALQEYSWDAVADAYEDLFSALRTART